MIRFLCLAALLVPSGAFAAEDECKPLAQMVASTRDTVQPLTHEEWIWLKGFFTALPPVLEGQIPGTGTVLVLRQNDRPAIVWTHDDLACETTIVTNAFVEALHGKGRSQQSRYDAPL